MQGYILELLRQTPLQNLYYFVIAFLFQATKMNDI